MNHPLGQAAALLAALAWACALVLFKRSGERVSPIALNLFKNAIGISLLAATLALLAALDTWFGLLDGEYRATLLFRLSAIDYAILAASGIIGIAVADTVFFYALNLIGVGLISIVDCCYSPSVLLFAWLMLGETLLPYHYLGGGLILAGILIASGHKPPPGRTRGQILLGILLAALAISSMAFGIVLAKPVLPRVPVIWSTTVRLLAGTAALVMVAAFLPGRAEYLTVFKPARVWRHAIPAAFLGTYVSLIAWVAGFRYTYASVAAVLNQTSIVFALILASVFLKERFGLRKLLAAEMALVGVLIITFPDAARRLAVQPLPVICVAALLLLVPASYHALWRRRAAAFSPVLPSAAVGHEEVLIEITSARSAPPQPAPVPPADCSI